MNVCMYVCVIFFEAGLGNMMTSSLWIYHNVFLSILRILSNLKEQWPAACFIRKSCLTGFIAVQNDHYCNNRRHNMDTAMKISSSKVTLYFSHFPAHLLWGSNNKHKNHYFSPIVRVQWSSQFGQLSRLAYTNPLQCSPTGVQRGVSNIYCVYNSLPHFYLSKVKEGLLPALAR